MALVKLGSLVTRISGKIGGQTLGTSASGSYIKNSGTPRKAITLRQQTSMQRMATTAQSWRNLSESDRQLFRSASPQYPYLNRVGETKYYSGYAIYTMLRNNLLQIGVFSQPIPLPKDTFAPIPSFQLEWGRGELTTNTTAAELDTDYRLFMSRPVSRGVTDSYVNHYFLRIITGAQMGVVQNITEEVAERFGAVPVGSRFYWRVDGVNQTTGQALENIKSGFVDIV